MDYIKTLLFGNVVMMIPWSCLLLVIQWTGIRLYNIRDPEECRRIQKRIGKNCTHTVDGKGGGYAIALTYIAYVEYNEHVDNYNVWIMTTQKVFTELTKPSKGSDISMDGSTECETVSVDIYERCGSYSYLFFKKRTITIGLEPRRNQKPILTSVVDFYQRKERAVVYLHGPPGSGKSVVGLLLAKELGASFCNNLKPWQPGDTIGELYSDVEPTKEKPLILVFDEFDTALVRFPIPPHNTIPISVPDKAGWNRMMDEIHWGLYPYMIVVLTSNRPPQFIKDLDPSYIRKGRVDIIKAM